jgi:signal peptide peptidase SppA
MKTTILDLVCSPWAVLPEWGDQLYGIYQRWAKGETIDIAQLEARRGAPLPGPQPGGYEIRNGVAVVRMQGTLAQRMNVMSDVSGGTSTELLARDITQATDDPKAKGILLLADTPGGMVAGTPGAAEALYRARGRKPTAMLVDELAASAGYWIGSAAEKIYLGSTVAQAGSIGVIRRHVSQARALEGAGIDVTHIYAGKYKAAGSDAKRLSEEDKAVLQEQIDAMYSVFVNAVAKYRGQSVERVLSDMADGRVFMGQQAIDAGLADGLHSLDGLIAEIGDRAKWRPIIPGKSATTGPPAAAHLPPLRSSMSLSPEVAQWAADNPDAANALRAEGAASEREKFQIELEAAKVVARSEGAAAEAKRAADVRAQGLRGHEALIEQLASDGHTTGAEAAVAVLAAERQLQQSAASSMASEVPAPVAFAATGGASESKPTPQTMDATAITHKAADLMRESQASGRPLALELATEKAIAILYPNAIS